MTLGCACGGSSRSTAAAQADAANTGGSSPYVYEVTYTDGTTARFDTEAEALAALATTGGGLRMVARGS